jgi:hypothetical protein
MLIHAYAVIIITLAMFYKGNGDMKKANVLSYGVNKMGDSDGIIPGIHAEYDAIRKLVPLQRNKRLKVINILVIQMSIKNKLQLSKPCANCIQMMKIFPEKLGYKVKHIYYSDNNGDIVKSDLKSLDNEEKHISRFYRKKNK